MSLRAGVARLTLTPVSPVHFGVHVTAPAVFTQDAPLAVEVVDAKGTVEQALIVALGPARFAAAHARRDAVANTGRRTSTLRLPHDDRLSNSRSRYIFGATSDGTLYADSSGKSYEINPATGAATTLGNLGFTSTGGLNGDDKGNLYLTGGSQSQGLYQVNRTTGQGTLIGTSTYGTVYGLADTGGTLYAINTTGSVFSVNMATAASTLTATYNVATAVSVYAAAAQPSPAPVPEASTTLSLGLLLGLGGVVVSARRKAASTP